MIKLPFTKYSDSIEDYLYYKTFDYEESHGDIISQHNDKLRVVPYRYQLSNKDPVVFYKVRNYTPLSKVFFRRRLKLNELILVLYGTIHTIKNGTKCGLYESSFVLEPEHVYLTNDSIQPYLIYVPAKLDINLNKQLLGFLDFLHDACDPASTGTHKLVNACRDMLKDGYDLNAIVSLVVQAANQKIIERPDGKPISETVVVKSQPSKVEVYAEAKPKAPQQHPQRLEEPEAQVAKDAKKQGVFSKFFGGEAQQTKPEDFMPTIDDRTMIDFTIYDEDEDRPSLYELENGSRTKQIYITKDTFVLGRDKSQCDVVFSDPQDKGVSRAHASIIFDGVRWFLIDKHSSGGTFLNDVRILPNGSEPLKNGDKIRLYKKELLFELED